MLASTIVNISMKEVKQPVKLADFMLSFGTQAKPQPVYREPQESMVQKIWAFAAGIGALPVAKQPVDTSLRDSPIAHSATETNATAE